MSIVRTDFGVLYEVTAGTTKTLEATMTDPDTGEAQDMSDTDIFATGIVKIFKPDYTTAIGSDMAINFGDPADRLAGLIKFTVSGTDQATIANAGNWIGEIEISNTTPVVVNQKQFNINIIMSK